MTWFLSFDPVASLPHASPRRSPAAGPGSGTPRYIRSLLMAGLLSLCHIMPVMAAEAASTPALDLNTATAEALADRLERIGRVRAEAIVAWREKNGKFTSVDQLSAIPGVGAAVVELNRDRIIVK